MKAYIKAGNTSSKIGTYIKAKSSYDPDAQAFFTAAGITDNTQKNAINTLVINCKAAGIWTKMKAIYPFVGGTATTHKFNLKNPADTNAAFRLVFNGGWTHSSNGALPNGVNSFAESYLTPSTSLSANSAHLSYYSRTNVNLTQIEIGCQDVNAYTIIEARTANVSYFLVNTNTISGVADTNSEAFYLANRTASNVTNGFINSSKIFNSTVASSALPIQSIYIGALHNPGGAAQYYSTKQCAFSSIGDGLTDTEALVFNQIVEGYQYELGRNVNPFNPNYYNAAYNNETNAFLYASQITDNTQKSAVNTFVNDLKTAGIWTKMKAVYPLVGGTASTHKWNLKDPQDTNAAFRITFSGGWTHSSNGALPNGTNGYANTFFNLSTGFTSANKGSAGGYWRTALPNGNYFFGVNDPVGGINSRFWIRHVGVPNKDHYAGGLTVLRDTTITDYSGFSAMCRRSTTDMFAIKRDGTYITLATSVTTGFSNRTLPFAAQDSSGVYGSFSNAEIALGYISDDITQAEMTNLRTAIITFQTTLGRQV